jgi:4'-phosphopantetheinyl transferase EntD
MPWPAAVPCVQPAAVWMRELASALSALLPAAGIGWADPRLTPPGDLPAAATEARRREFAAGRTAAAHALAALGIVADVPMGPDRAPIWPERICGSITHTRTIALAVALKGGSIGIDLETDGAVTPDLWPEILLPEERALASQNPALATQLFCAKEAVFKAQYPLTKAMFGFDRIHITPHGPTFTARFMATTGPLSEGTTWRGHLIRAESHILALCRP